MKNLLKKKTILPGGLYLRYDMNALLSLAERDIDIKDMLENPSDECIGAVLRAGLSRCFEESEFSPAKVNAFTQQILEQGDDYIESKIISALSDALDSGIPPPEEVENYTGNFSSYEILRTSFCDIMGKTEHLFLTLTPGEITRRIMCYSELKYPKRDDKAKSVKLPKGFDPENDYGLRAIFERKEIG